jgi:hypothetical protein
MWSGVRMALAAPVKLLTSMIYLFWPIWRPTQIFAWGRAGDASPTMPTPISVEVRFQKPWDPSGAFLLPACRAHYETVSFSKTFPGTFCRHSATTAVPQGLPALFRAATMAACGGCKNDKKCLCRRRCGVVAFQREGFGEGFCLEPFDLERFRS